MEQKEVPIYADYKESLTALIGKLTPLSPDGRLIIGLLQEGYEFTIAPEIIYDGYDKDGEMINPRLVSVSIITSTAKQIETRRST